MTEITDGSAKFAVEYRKATFHGMIMPFSGNFSSDGYPIDSATDTVRKDWHICDGTKGTPDLRERFIRGASTMYPKGSTGGAEYTEHQHQLPLGFDNVKNFFTITGSDYNPVFGSTVSETTSYNSGSNVYNNINIDRNKSRIAFSSSTKLPTIPPFYALSYIMKL